MTAPVVESISLRSKQYSPWVDLGGDGKPHEIKDPSKIPSHLLTNEQVKALQAEVTRLRQKNAQRKQALRDLNYAMERKSHTLAVAQADRYDMGSVIDDYAVKNRQLRERLGI